MESEVGRLRPLLQRPNLDWSDLRVRSLLARTLIASTRRCFALQVEIVDSPLLVQLQPLFLLAVAWNIGFSRKPRTFFHVANVILEAACRI